MKVCVTQGCKDFGKPLGAQDKGYVATLYTRSRGTLAVRVVSLYCPSAFISLSLHYLRLMSIQSARPAIDQITSFEMLGLQQLSEYTTAGSLMSLRSPSIHMSRPLSLGYFVTKWLSLSMSSCR